MRNFKKVVFATITAIVLTVSISCSSTKEDSNPCADTEHITQIANAYSSALQAYYNNATTENCTTLKSTGKDYIDLLKSMLDCAGASDLQGLRDDIAEAEAALNDAC